MAVNVKEVLERYHNDPGRLMDILTDVQAENGCVSDEAIYEIISTVRKPGERTPSILTTAQWRI